MWGSDKDLPKQKQKQKLNRNRTETEMNSTSSSLSIARNGRRRKFIGTVRGVEVTFLSYKKVAGGVDFYHSETLPEHRELGYGRLVVEAALRWANEEGLTVIPSCSFVTSVLALSNRNT